MSNAARDDPYASGGPPPELANRLGYLLKHAQLRLAELNAQALAPYGITGRELAVLLVLEGAGPTSQQQAARRLQVDRTSMVALIDMLENKGLVARRPDPADRRRNVVVLTEAGRDTLRKAAKASDDAERRLLAPLATPAAEGLKRALQTVIQR